MTDNVPAYLKKFTQQNSQMTESMISSSSNSVPRISLKGKKFQFIHGEDESKKFSEIDVAIIGVTPNGSNMIKTYYSAGYDPSNTAPPDCSSSDGIVPDAWVSEPVSDNCRHCPMNIFGSAKSASGKKAKACKDSKRLWVAKPDDITGTLYALNVPVTSIKNMAEYGKQIQKAGIPLAAIITKLTMDEDSEFPLIQFSQNGFMAEAQGLKALERSLEKEWDTDSARSAPALENKAEKEKKADSKSEKAEKSKESEKTKKANVSDGDVDDIMNDWED